MTILWVSGVMDLGVMAAVATAITTERLAPWPTGAARTIGVIAVAAGIILVARVLVPMS